MQMKRFPAAAVAACLVLSCLGCAAAEEGNEKRLNVIRMEMPGKGESRVAYPLAVFSDGDGRAALINADLFASARIGEYLALLSTLPESGTGLKMDYTLFPETEGGYAADGVVSVVLSAQGRMLEGRPSQVWYPMVYDLAACSRVESRDLFTDPEAAEAAVEAYLASHAQDALSDYLENREMFPVPMDSFALCERGIIYYYSHDALCFLSGFSGEVLIPYGALEGVLDVSEGSVLSRFLALSGTGSAQALFDALEQGRMFGVPASVGEDTDGALSRLRTGFDSSWWPGGEMWETEDARMRGIWIVSLDESGTVDGIFAEDADLGLLATGKTSRSAWRESLGAPDGTGEVTDASPLKSIMGPGTGDIYIRGDHMLVLHAGEDGVLSGILVANTQKGLYE